MTELPRPNEQSIEPTNPSELGNLVFASFESNTNPEALLETEQILNEVVFSAHKSLSLVRDLLNE